MVASAALVANDFISFDADQRRDIATAAKLLGDFVRNEVAVGEDLEVAIAMLGKDFQCECTSSDICHG